MTDFTAMKHPPHPGDLIRTEIIEQRGLSISRCAAILKVGRSRLSSLLAGKAALSPEMAIRLEKAFGPDANHLLHMQVAYDVAKIRQSAERIAKTRQNEREAPVDADMLKRIDAARARPECVVEPSSGNVFRDIGFSKREADLLAAVADERVECAKIAKAYADRSRDPVAKRAARRIARSIQSRKWTTFFKRRDESDIPAEFLADRTSTKRPRVGSERSPSTKRARSNPKGEWYEEKAPQ